MQKYYFTSESVTEGHPDKICDQISDGILDAIISQDPNCRVACETAITTGVAFLMGEITTSCYVDIPKIARQVIADIGYTNADFGFDSKSCAVMTSIDEQSRDIALGVDNSLEVKKGSNNEDDLNGAGDQGMMFGYACNETPELMPMAIVLAHKLTKKLSEARKNGELGYLRPDGKSQVTVEYIDDKPVRVDKVVVSTQHAPEIDNYQLYNDLLSKVIIPSIPEDMMDADTKIFINPTGRFVVGGPQGDSGLTGRKIIVDTYGGYARHGGGAFSGKDPTKVDRSAAYAARYVAKNIVAAKLAEKCEIQIAYAIGMAHPVSITVSTFNTSGFLDAELVNAINAVFDLRPAAIIKQLELAKPIYRQLAAYGHMGREDLGVKWEQIDKVDELKKYFKIS